MNVEKSISDKQLLLKIKYLLSKYSSAYTKEEKNHILKNYNWIKYNDYYDYILREIYDELGMINPDKNLYLGFIELINEKFGLNKNVVEIGGGIIPNLSKHIALKQQTGTITVFDPRLAEIKYNTPNLELKKEKFTPEKLPQNTELLVGIHPYGATRTIYETACKYDIDFIIALGDLPVDVNTFIDENELDIELHHLIYDARRLVEKSNLGTLHVDNLDQYNSTYPIIYNKRK